MKNRVRELRTAVGMTQQLAGLVLLLPRGDEQDGHISKKSAWWLP